MKRLMWLAVLLALSVALVGCGAGREDEGAAHPHGESESGDDPSTDAGSVPGEPGDPSGGDTEIPVVASDELKFDPATIEVKAGEVVTFIVRNEGKTEHEFVLGDEAYQLAHAKDVAEGGHDMEDMENAVTVAPGETAELTWRFSEGGEVLYGCHVPGHYDGGMVGTVEVDE